MKHRRFLEGKCLDNTKTPPRRSYFKYRDTTELENERNKRKQKRQQRYNMKIRIWPDGTWQSTEDTPYSWMSDDYEIHYVPDNIDSDDYVKDNYGKKSF